ncbi:MAG TPA: hypothetical protein VH019_00950 [Rhizomicrobium sp.]|nr:hypothetical protein [Rhizomicrobium sp.]
MPIVGQAWTFTKNLLSRKAEGIPLLLGLAFLTLLFLAIALWNRFPLVFYDTGGYLAEGLEGAFLPERSPVYSLFLNVTGSAVSLWPVVILQAAMTAYLITLTARAEVDRLSLGGLILLGAILMLATGIGWYVGQVEPDCMTALVVLGAYLLLFRSRFLGRSQSVLVGAITGLAVACHPSHLGLMAGLLIVAACLRWIWRNSNLQLLPAFGAFILALALIFTSNYVLTRQIFLSRSASVFVFARLMQDGIVKRLLDDTCPGSGYSLCGNQNRLKTRADAWLWGPDSLFRAEGGFRGSHDEETRMIADSIRRYPLLQLVDAARDSVQQFFTFKTGDGIESQEWVLRPVFEKDAPGQLPAYRAARQQREGRFRFTTLNMVHVTVGMLSLLGLIVLLHGLVRERQWQALRFPALVLLALIGNAIVCATFSNPHDRYQSRVIWLPALVLILARMKNPNVLRGPEESGT